MFIQVIDFTTTRPDDVRELAQRWGADASDNGTATRVYLCRDRDDASRMQMIVEFPSYDEAMRNSGRDETDQFFREFSALCDGEPAFRNLDVAESWSGA